MPWNKGISVLLTWVHCGSANSLRPLITHAQNGTVVPKWGKRKESAFYLESRDMLRASIFSACWHSSCQVGTSERATQAIEKRSRSQKEGRDSGDESSSTQTPAPKLEHLPPPSSQSERRGEGGRWLSMGPWVSTKQGPWLMAFWGLFHIFTHLHFLCPKQPFTVFDVFSPLIEP